MDEISRTIDLTAGASLRIASSCLLMQYKAMDARGRITTGQIEAVNIADLEVRLDRLGLDLVN